MEDPEAGVKAGIVAGDARLSFEERVPVVEEGVRGVCGPIAVARPKRFPALRREPMLRNSRGGPLLPTQGDTWG